MLMEGVYSSGDLSNKNIFGTEKCFALWILYKMKNARKWVCQGND